MLNTATSLISDVIGSDAENSAFVYGCYSLFDKFANELKEALKSLRDNIKLDPYDKKFENDAKNIHTAKSINQEMLTSFEHIFKEWSD